MSETNSPPSISSAAWVETKVCLSVLSRSSPSHGVALVILTVTLKSPSLKRSAPDRKSTRLNSSHANISYAVFCLKKKNKLNGIHSVKLCLYIRLIHSVHLHPSAFSSSLGTRNAYICASYICHSTPIIYSHHLLAY